ncbi:MAG TPA: TIM-barrel domain-containing protein [Polyangiaceae bacterium]|jgi:alpha-glucosidase|nr:TIM-barrel domain-containing protein [Polyangiaceae bacterium]
MHRALRLICPCLAVALLATDGLADVQRKKFTTPDAYLIVEALDDDLVHVEVARGAGPAEAAPLYSSPMVLGAGYSGASTFTLSGNTLETAALRIEVNPATLEVAVFDKSRGNALLTRLRAKDLGQDSKRIEIEPGAMQNVYGLGQKFMQLGSADGDWRAHGKREGGELGNAFQEFQRAAVGNVQIPIMYALGPNNLGYGLFLDNVYRQAWVFNQSPWQVSTFGDQLRFYILAGPSLLDVRQDYLELTGRPPVPPRKAFGLWVSEFGYDNWEQVEALRNGLRDSGFPIDGFVLDLNWFGGVSPNQPCCSQMGRLDWDQSATDANAYYFPNPGQRINAFWNDHIGLALIEESYVADTTTTHAQMPERYMVYQRKNGACDPLAQSHAARVSAEDFWGNGRMIDWSDPEAGAFIQDQRRYPNLIKRGISVHWTDLGEPERFDSSGCYDGVETAPTGLKNAHPDLHNLYNLLWNRAIWDGYVAKKGQPNDLGQRNVRPLILTRSGAAGTQRFGAAMWSGDIAGNLKSLASHLNAQLHMSFSGIDYYGADVGGFRREVMPPEPDNKGYRGYQEELYTQWFANASWFDVPLRPHTDNEFKKPCPPYPTSPHLVGKVPSNLANVRQRYELIPYYYSLAYRAQLAGEPVVAPPVLYYPEDPQLRVAGHEKLIGRDILVAAVARHGEYERNVYLPAGSWVNYHTNEWFHGAAGREIANLPAYRDGLFRLPVFVRAGALLPQMFVDANTKDAFGHRKSGPARSELIVRAYAGAPSSTFTLYEDDGQTLDYDAAGRPLYRYRTTPLLQETTSPTLVKVEIGAAAQVGGTAAIAGLVNSRKNIVRLVVDNARATAVTLNGAALPEQPSAAAFEAAASGWRNSDTNLIEAKSTSLPVTAAKRFQFTLQPTTPVASVSFICDNAGTQFGERIYVSGNIPALGNLDVTQAVPLAPDIYYEYIWNPPKNPDGTGPSRPLWTGVVGQLPINTPFQWRCVREQADGSGTPQLGGLQSFQTGASGGYAGRSLGSL